MSSCLGTVLCFIASFLAVNGLISADTTSVKDFDDFARKYKRSYVFGSKEYDERKAMFERHAAAVGAHNSRPGRTWTAGFSRLADHTDAELAGLRGYTHVASRSSGGHASLLSRSGALSDAAALPGNFTWHGALKALIEPKDQSTCGSCWAVAASAVLRAHSEIWSQDRTFSTQQLVMCTPNPQHCGGQGGCEGATASLALQYAAEAGVIPEDAWEYTALPEDCPAELSIPNASQGILKRGRVFNLNGFRQLSENKVAAILNALVTSGPVAVALAAEANWNLYESGILESCLRDTVINHAVVLMGYGSEAAGPFWHIMNSWGSEWGEQGFLRLQRRDDAEEEAYCGWDTKPEQGSGCDGGPSKVWICGSCGILYDANHPVFGGVAGSAWDQAGGDLLRAAGLLRVQRERDLRSPPPLFQRPMM